MLFGGADTDFWYDILYLALKDLTVYGTIEQLIMAKYLRNSFLSYKSSVPMKSAIFVKQLI